MTEISTAVFPFTSTEYEILSVPPNEAILLGG